MPKKNIHPNMHEMKLKTVNGLELTTMTTKDMRGKMLNSDFDEAALPWNRVGLGGGITAKDASVQKYRSRQGSALDFASVLSSNTSSK
ncbi:MAG: hypothetical protein JJW01_01415 [Alphaproteobacteria bacterium]|nr:hypothetical protein [Rickettsiales bacterium]